MTQRFYRATALGMLAAALVLLPSRVSAQQWVAPTTDTPMRLTFRDSTAQGVRLEKLGGVYQGTSGDTLLVRESYGAVSRVPRRDVVQIQIGERHHHRWVHDPLVGAAIGFAIGQLATGTDAYDRPGDHDFTLNFVFVGGALGAGVAWIGRTGWTKLGAAVR